MWYGKAPGLDRAADSLRHGNFVGVSRTGGALAIVGDDPGCKSSTIPSASESMLASLQMPVFYPGNVQEVLDLGLHALACSRASGLWSGFKIVTSVADAVGSAMVARDRITPVLPDVEWNGSRTSTCRTATCCARVARAWSARCSAAHRAGARLRARERRQPDRGRRDAWLGIVAAGKTYYDLMHALRGSARRRGSSARASASSSSG
jgi:indolepyruvate ferredoxin oxidoreductase